jgi:hypothetical protein
VVNALEVLLWAAVCVSENKTDHVSIIVHMEDELASELQFVVQEQQSKVTQPSPDLSADASGGADADAESPEEEAPPESEKVLEKHDAEVLPPSGLEEKITALQSELEESRAR